LLKAKKIAKAAATTVTPMVAAMITSVSVKAEEGVPRQRRRGVQKEDMDGDRLTQLSEAGIDYGR
jgi:histone H3/H4